MRDISTSFETEAMHDALTEQVHITARVRRLVGSENAPLTGGSELIGRGKNMLLVRDETDNETGSFKIRGAGNAVLKGYDAGYRDFVSASRGNHAQGVVVAAMKAGPDTTVTVHVPERTPPAKLDKLLRLQAAYGHDRVRLVVAGDTFESCEQRAQDDEKIQGYRNVHPFNDTDVMDGQGTIVSELADQLQTRGIKPAEVYLFVPVGGGGLLAGVSEAASRVAPDMTVIGVQVEGSDSAYKSFTSGDGVQDATRPNELVDGLSVMRAGDECMTRIRKYAAGLMLVSAADVGREFERITGTQNELSWLQNYPTDFVTPEPAGAVAEAGARRFADTHPDVAGKVFIALQTGRNVRDGDIEALMNTAQAERHSRRVVSIARPAGAYVLSGYTSLKSTRS